MLSRLFLTLALLISLSIESARTQEITLTFSHFLGPKSFFQVDVAEPFAAELAAKTNGKVKVQILNGADPQGKVNEQATNVKNGIVDIALGLRGAEGDKFPGSSVIELPFLIPDALRGSRARCGRCMPTARWPTNTRTTKCSHCSCTIPG
jgi:TRAP-type C4-dicarboxylate transport system substrate-binding protein